MMHILPPENNNSDVEIIKRWNLVLENCEEDFRDRIIPYLQEYRDYKGTYESEVLPIINKATDSPVDMMEMAVFKKLKIHPQFSTFFDNKEIKIVEKRFYQSYPILKEYNEATDKEEFLRRLQEELSDLNNPSSKRNTEQISNIPEFSDNIRSDILNTNLQLPMIEMCENKKLKKNTLKIQKEHISGPYTWSGKSGDGISPQTYKDMKLICDVNSAIDRMLQNSEKKESAKAHKNSGDQKEEKVKNAIERREVKEYADGGPYKYVRGDLSKVLSILHQMETKEYKSKKYRGRITKRIDFGKYPKVRRILSADGKSVETHYVAVADDYPEFWKKSKSI